MLRPTVLHLATARPTKAGASLALVPLMTATRGVQRYARPTRRTRWQHRPSLTHAHDLGAAAWLNDRTLGRQPLALTVDRPPSPGELALVRRADLVVCESAAVKEALTGHVDRARLILLPQPGSRQVDRAWLAAEPGALAADLEEQYLALITSGRPAAVRHPPPAMPAMSVVMVTGDRRSQLRDSLKALLSQDYPAELTQLIVVDNASSDGSSDDLRAVQDLRLHVVTGKQRVPAYVARNRALAVATGDIVAFTDDDCYPQRRWLAALAAGFRSGIGIVQGATEPNPGTAITPMVRTLWTPAEFGLYETANIAYRRALLRGGFDEQFGSRLAAAVGRRLAGIPMGEDTELAWRLKRGGAESRFAVTAVVRHHVWPADFGFQLRRAVLGGLGFPALVREVPELRDAFLWRRLFLTPRHAGLLLATPAPVLVRRRPLLSLVIVLPYLALAVRPRTPGRRGRALALPKILLRDLVEVGATMVGAVRSGELVF